MFYLALSQRYSHNTKYWVKHQQSILDLKGNKSNRLVTRKKEEDLKKRDRRTTNTKSEGGKGKGIINFMKKKLATLVDLVEEHKPCGAFQWILYLRLFMVLVIKTRNKMHAKRNLIGYGKPINQLVLWKCHYV